MIHLRVLLASLMLLSQIFDVNAGGKSAKGSHAAGGLGSSGEEEIIIPLGGEINLGGLGGGRSFSIPLEPGIQLPAGTGATSMGFEETEEIGPDGKPHIISQKAFNPNGGKLTKAQLQAQKKMEKEMQGMAKDMSHMFEGGALFGGGRQAQKQQKWEDDLMKQAMKTFQAENQIVPRKVGGAQQLSRNSWNQAPTGVDPNRGAQRKIPNGWEVTGNSDILNNAGIIIASCLLVGFLALFGMRYYKTKVQYRPVADEGIEVL